MANEEQLEILRQGVEVWNEWREENPLFDIDLSEVNVEGLDLNNANLVGVDFRDSKFWNVSLNNANLGGTSLFGVNFIGANLIGADLTQALFGVTVLSDVDLSKTKGLEEITHLYSSIISTDTIQKSKGKIPEIFLRGCGMSDLDIEYAKLYKPELSNKEIADINYKIFDLRANRAIQVSPLFISYSHGDTEFVDKLEPQFIEKGIRFWRDIHDMKAGRMEKQVDHAMRQNPTVILVLSENSIRSDWVEHEATLARKLEKEFGRDVLCPVALDDSWKSAKWPQRLMEQIMEYNILDFSKWKDDGEFGKMFNKMVAGLDMFYKAG